MNTVCRYLGSCFQQTPFLFWLSVFLVTCLALAVHAVASEGEAARIIDVRGEAWVAGSETDAPRIPAEKGMAINPGDTLITGQTGRLFILCADESLVQINSDTSFAIDRVTRSAGWFEKNQIMKAADHAADSIYRLIRGEIWLRNKNRHREIEIELSTVVVGVRGTELNMMTDGADLSVVTVLRGKVVAANEMGSIPVAAGYQVTAAAGQPLKAVLLLTPENAVQWTLTIPDALFYPSFHSSDPVSEKEAGRMIYDAAARLKSGKISESYDEFKKLTQQYPQNAAAFQFLSLAALLTGKNIEARDAARKSVALAPTDAHGYNLLCYALQVDFDLPGAALAAKEAIRVDSGNVTALLALARLQFGMDERDDALKSLQQARRIAPETAEVSSLEGFMLLAAGKTDPAAGAFARAIQQDAALGEPHLGLALCHMRKGEPEAAMAEMSAAVLLEPRRSLFVSYWAKMLYELKRFDEALDMLAFARELDPRDPTPFLYEGIIYRDMNQPVSAVASLHQALALNDNRGVYRSRFLLDQDLAVKNVNHYLLYESLGLSAWAQSKALRAIKQDYTNFAGHLFYGNALLNSGDRTIASGAELLLGRMLQPATFNSLSSFNDYTSFFDGPAINGYLSGFYGNHDTLGGNAGLYGGAPSSRIAFQASVDSKSTDGWRKNLDERGKGAATVVKFDPSMDDHLTLSWRELENNQEDEMTGRNEYDQEPNPIASFESESRRGELGYHHHFSPKSDFLFFFAWSEDEGCIEDYERTENVFGMDGVTLDAFSLTDYKRPYVQAQVQQFYSIGAHQFIAGLLHYSGNKDTAIKSMDYYSYYGEELDVQYYEAAHDPDHRLISAYLADSWRLAPDWILESAVYYDAMTNSNAAAGTEWELHNINPRLGLIWEAGAADTFRLAGFQYLLPFTANRIDPMEIAGIPIFRNTGEGSLTKEADLIWEHEWRNAFFTAGVFYLNRENTSVLLDGDQNVKDTDKGRLKGAEWACNQILGPGLAMTAGYRFQDIYDEFMPGRDRNEHLTSIGLKYVHPTGFSAGLAQSFRYMDFERSLMDNEDIWITDAGLSYEFPGKYGLASLGINNIFDNHFNWVEDVFVFRRRTPAREVVCSLSLYF